MSGGLQKELFSSVVSDIKTYKGEDPLRPWLQGIRKMQQCLPHHTLREKLPRFLQKCAQTFESDRRYRNDPRYLRVWIRLMDHVNDPRGVLRRMEKNQIGMKWAAFYSAYALYYEKQKKFEKAEKMYHLGVQNLAEPADELQKSYEQFLHRMELYKKRRALQETGARTTSKTTPPHHQEISITRDNKLEGLGKAEVKIHSDGQMVGINGTCQSSLSNIGHQKNSEQVNVTKGQVGLAQESVENTPDFMNVSRGKSILKTHLLSTQFKGEVAACNAGLIGGDCIKNIVSGNTSDRTFSEDRRKTDKDSVKPNPFSSEDTVVVKFVGSAIVGKSEAEDACHHGLVDPTINMKEAMNAISSMFREPLESDPKLKRKFQHNRTKANQQNRNGFEVFIDGSLDEGVDFYEQNKENGDHKATKNALSKKQTETEKPKPFVETFKILADDEDDSECDNVDRMDIKNLTESSRPPAHFVNASVHSKPEILPLVCRVEQDIFGSEDVKLKDDTVFRRFVGSTVFGGPEVENACHHGLVDPTINLKEAMDDINSMFGKPINFVKTSKPKKRENLTGQKQGNIGFSILADEDPEVPTQQGSPSFSRKSGGGCDLFEPTVFTKEAMAEINEMFGKPLDF